VIASATPSSRRGDPEQRLEGAALEEKFHRLARVRVDAATAAELQAAALAATADDAALAALSALTAALYTAGPRRLTGSGHARGIRSGHRSEICARLPRRSARPVSVGSAMIPRRSARSVVRLSSPSRSKRRSASETEGRETLR
jgi:GH24 family phage-related lysozyme (muramidase)